MAVLTPKVHFLAVLSSGLLSAVLLLSGILFTQKTTFSHHTHVEISNIHNPRFGRPENINLQADDYTFLSYKLTNAPKDMPLILFWRTAEHPDTFHDRLLPQTSSNSGTIALWNHAKWSGQILQIGIAPFEQSAPARAQIQYSLSSYTSELFIKALWEEWLSPIKRSHTTINYTSTIVEYPILYPVPAIAAWISLAVLLYWLLSLRLKFEVDAITVLLFVVFGWVILDLRWQSLLWYQLADTSKHYADKTYQEKYTVGPDAELYAYVNRIKRDHLPVEASRIFILREAHKGHEYNRIRTQYFLLPHNIYNFGNTPPEDSLKDGDFILVIGKLPTIHYSSATHRLLWDNEQKSVNAQQLDKQEFATLYRVFAPTMDENP